MQTEVVELLSYNAVKVITSQVSLILKNLIISCALFFLLGFNYFWSLVHHCSNSSLSVLISVEEMLKNMQPGLDWSHLE